MLVIFDCDGVLVDSETIAARVDAEALTEAGYPIDADTVARRFAGLTTRRIFEIAAEELGRPIPDHHFKSAYDRLDERLAEEATAVAGAAEMLKRIEAPRCVCSNSSPERLRLTLGRAGLWDALAPHVFSAKAVREGRPKPAPDVYLHAAEILQVPPAQAVVVEDSVTGATAAVAAGMRVIGFTGASHSWPGHGEVLMDAGALTVVARHAEVPATVAALADWRAVV